MIDAAEHLAMRHAIELSADLEVQLRDKKGMRPMLAMLDLARKQAAIALAQLATADAENPKEIRDLQNEVRLFTEMVAWAKHIILEGIEADRQVSDEDHQDILQVMDLTPEAIAEMASLGISVQDDQQGRDA